VYVGSFDGSFYALDAATGALAWKFTTDRWRDALLRQLGRAAVRDQL